MTQDHLTPEERAHLEQQAGGYLSRCRPYLLRQQRERRAMRVRIDFYPSENAQAALAELEGSNSQRINQVIEEWAELKQDR